MKTRNSLVSNSSSSSFIIRGLKFELRNLYDILKINNLTNEERQDRESTIRKILREQFKCDLEVTPCQNYFMRDESYTHVILGLPANQSLEDGEIIELTSGDKIDDQVIEEFKKLGFNGINLLSPKKLSTFVQYVSNDNC